MSKVYTKEKTENAHDTPAARTRPLCMHASKEMEHYTEHIRFNYCFVKQYGSDELVLCQCLYMLSCRNAGEGDYCTSDPNPMAVFVDQNEGLSDCDIYTLVVYFFHAQTKCTSRFLWSQTFLNLTKYIENNMNSCISS